MGQTGKPLLNDPNLGVSRWSPSVRPVITPFKFATLALFEMANQHVKSNINKLYSSYSIKLFV